MPVTRLALVDDHVLAAHGLARALSLEADIELVVAVATVKGLAAYADDVDLALLDPRLAANSGLREAVAALAQLGVQVLLYADSQDPATPGLLASVPEIPAVDKCTSLPSLRDAIRALAPSTGSASIGSPSIGAPTARPATASAATSPDPEPRPRFYPEPLDPRLSDRERDVLTRYAGGATARQVAAAYGISQHSVAGYLQRIRRKYARVGRAAPGRVDLYHRAIEDMLLVPESTGDVLPIR